jgi:hypothetical protein
MQISFERSGGFIGTPITITLDTATLSPDHANQLRRLVNAADFFNVPATIAPSSSQPDRFQYKVTIQEGDRHHTVTVGEAAIPSTLKPLLDWMMEAIRNRAT